MLKVEFGFVAISKHDFFQSLDLPADIYVKLSGEKFICISKKGSKIPLDKLHVSQNDSLTHFYVKESDYKGFLDYNLSVSATALKHPSLSVDQSLAFLSMSMNSLYSMVDSAGLERQSLVSSEEMARSITQLVQKKPPLSVLIAKLDKLGPRIIQETMLTTVLSVTLGEMIGITGERRQLLTLAALMHDVGLAELPNELLTKKRSEMTIEERYTYETHTLRGAELILSANPEAPPELIQVAMQHHETSNRMGYPNKLDELKVHPFARIVSICDWISDYVVSTPDSDPKENRNFSKGLAALEAIGVPYSAQLFKNLKKIEKI